MLEIMDWIEANWRIDTLTQVKVASTLLIVFILVLVRGLIIGIAIRRIEDHVLLYRWRKGTEYAAYFLGLLAVARIWVTGTQSIATYLGLLSAGLAIALQDPIVNIVGWLFIVWRRPFEVGDRVEIGGHAGDVIDVRFFQFTLMEIRNWVEADQSTGRVLHLPNKMVFNEGIANFSKGFEYLWNEIPVEITFESDWKRAKEALEEIANRHAAHLNDTARERVRRASRRYMIHFENLTPIVYTKVNQHGVLLTLRYLTAPRKRRNTEQVIWEDILEAFALEPDIEFAYPTQRIYYHPTEGRPSLRPDQLKEAGLHPLPGRHSNANVRRQE